MLTQINGDDTMGSDLLFSQGDSGHCAASRAALGRAVEMADPKLAARLRMQDRSAPRESDCQDSSRISSVQQYFHVQKGELTESAISELKVHAERNPVKLEVFLLAVDSPLLHSTSWQEWNDKLCGEATVCYADKNEHIVCLWNGYDHCQITKLLETFASDIIVEYWKAPTDYRPDYGIFERINGRSFHRRFVFRITGPVLYNTR
jgi:hypothetical protein